MILSVRCRYSAVANDRSYLLVGSPRSLANDDGWRRMFSNVLAFCFWFGACFLSEVIHWQTWFQTGRRFLNESRLRNSRGCFKVWVTVPELFDLISSSRLPMGWIGVLNFGQKVKPKLLCSKQSWLLRTIRWQIETSFCVSVRMWCQLMWNQRMICLGSSRSQRSGRLSVIGIFGMGLSLRMVLFGGAVMSSLIAWPVGFWR